MLLLVPRERKELRNSLFEDGFSFGNRGVVGRECKPLVVAVGIYKPKKNTERENVYVGGKVVNTVQSGSTIVVIQLSKMALRVPILCCPLKFLTTVLAFLNGVFPTSNY
jgi:hypothetical protein